MPTTTWNVSKDAAILSPSWGAGADIHMPIGYQSWATDPARGYLGFSYSFTGMTAITSATLFIRTSTGYHVGSGNWNDPDLYIDLVTSSWSEGTGGADEVYDSNGGGITWDNTPSVSTSNRVTWDVNGGSDPAEDTFYSVDITGLIQQAFSNGVFYGLRLMAVSEASSGDRIEFWTKNKGSAYDAYISVTYSTNTAPNAPTSLSPTGGAVQNTLTPTFTGNFSDPDAGDSMSGVQIQVSTDNTFASVTHWDSGTLTASGSSFSKTYAGSALSENVTYYWRARTKDAAGTWGAYSAAQSFKVNSIPNSPTISLQESPTSDILTLTPTFVITHSDPDSGDTKAYKYQIILETSAGAAVWDSGEITLGTPATTTNKLYNGPALSWQTSYRWRARTQDRNGAWSSYSSNATFTTHTTAVPVSLDPTGNTIASSTTPTLVGSRGDTDDSLTSAQVQVYQDDGTTLVWDSGTFTSGVSSTGFSKQVGTTLSADTFYKWRGRVTGSIGGTSAWSALQRFETPDTNTPTGTAPVGTGITDTTPDFTFTRSTNFNRHELFLYSEDDNFTASIWSDTPVSYTATGSKTVTSGVTLAYGKVYKWKVRVSADGGSNWTSFTGLIQFTMDVAGIPTLTAPISDSWQTTLTPTLTGNTFNSEVISTFRIILYASDQTTQVWDSGNLAGSGTSFSKVYNGPALSKGARYYWKASYVKSGGIPGGYSPLASFHINADPDAPTNRTPATGHVYADDASPVAPRFSADYSDGDKTTWGDFPTKIEVEVYRNSDSVLMYTLSKTASLSGSTNDLADGDGDVTKVNGPGGANLATETTYYWRARYTDSKSAAGSWSSNNTFKPSQAPTVAQVAPGATVSSPSFLIDWSFTSNGSKAQGTYRVRLRRQSDSVVVYDTGVVTSSTTQFTLPAGYLVNNTAYTILIDTTDTDGLASTQASNAVTTNWTAPDAPADFSAAGEPAISAVILTWTESNLSGADFSYYQIYRRKPGDEWERLASIVTKSTVQYLDYFAANATLYDYKITVFKKVVGDTDLESPDSDISSVILDADVWYVVGADRAASHIFELPVRGAPFTEPIQQEVFEPLGTSRKKIVRGRVLGAEGTLEVQWKDSERETALRQVAYIRDNRGPHILKSPFGDVWEVEFAGPAKNYEGGGHVLVSLAWTEVV